MGAGAPCGAAGRGASGAHGEGGSSRVAPAGDTSVWAKRTRGSASERSDGPGPLGSRGGGPRSAGALAALDGERAEPSARQVRRDLCAASGSTARRSACQAARHGWRPGRTGGGADGTALRSGRRRTPRTAARRCRRASARRRGSSARGCGRSSRQGGRTAIVSRLSRRGWLHGGRRRGKHVGVLEGVGVLVRPPCAGGVARRGVELDCEEGLSRRLIHVRRKDRLEPHARRGNVDRRDHNAREDKHVLRRSLCHLRQDKVADSKVTDGAHPDIDVQGW